MICAIISITTATSKLTSGGHPNFKNTYDKIRVTVFNTGDKIPEEDLTRIWGRFYKVDDSRNRENSGSGIGLSIVRAIQNNYQNEYGVQNLSNGVKFYFDISTKK